MDLLSSRCTEPGGEKSDIVVKRENSSERTPNWGELEVEKEHIRSDVMLPTWVISTDNVLVKDIEVAFQTDPKFRLQGDFRKWQAGLEHIKDTRKEDKRFRSGAKSIEVIVVRDESKAPEGLNWLAILKENVPAALVVVLMHEPSEEHINAALNAGAAALLEKPCPDHFHR